MSTTILHLDAPRVRIDLDQVEEPDKLILLTISDDDNTVLFGIKPKDLARLSHALGLAGEKISQHIASRLQQALDETANRSESEQFDVKTRD